MTTEPTPFETMDRLFEQIRRSMFGEFPQAGFGAELSGHSESAIRMDETEDGYVVMADLPGFETDDLDIHIDDDVLTISGTHTDESEDETLESYRQRHVEERVTIPGSVLVDDIEATYRNGVLEIHLPVEADADSGHHIQIE
ncbi:MAG: Hsp20/alpha crystallin family protein [Halorientalis sp.]